VQRPVNSAPVSPPPMAEILDEGMAYRAEHASASTWRPERLQR